MIENSPAPSRRILVTGAAGFLGRECTAQLRSLGHVVVTTDLSGDVDLAGDLAERAHTERLPDVDTVVHCAAVQYVSTSLPLLNRRPYFRRNNIEATALLCQRYQATGAHMVNVATSMMYRQDGSAVYAPSSPKQGDGVYSESKHAAWQQVMRSFPDNATIVPCIIGGRGREGLFRGFVKSIRNSGLAVFPGSGQHPTHMVHVQDVASLIVRAVESRAAGLFNAGAPLPLSIQDWVRVVADELSLPAPRLLRLPLAPIHALSAATGYRLLAREQLLMLAMPHVLDITDSLALGWRPRFETERIVRDIATYIATTDTPAATPNSAAK